jgi:hypothetical protein
MEDTTGAMLLFAGFLGAIGAQLIGNKNPSGWLVWVLSSFIVLMPSFEKGLYVTAIASLFSVFLNGLSWMRETGVLTVDEDREIRIRNTCTGISALIAVFMILYQGGTGNSLLEGLLNFSFWIGVVVMRQSAGFGWGLVCMGHIVLGILFWGLDGIYCKVYAVFQLIRIAQAVYFATKKQQA